MEIHIEKTQETKHLSFDGTVTDLLNELSINPTTVIVVQNGTVVLGDDCLSDSDSIKILSVVSGG